MKLEPTAAFVMHLGLPLFEADPLTKRYIEQLDLTSGQDLVEDYEKEDIYELAQENMCNRKFTVRHCLFSALDKATRPLQIVILAAGKSPLGLEAVVHKNDRVARLFEVDVSSLAEKAALYRRLAPDALGKIAFIEQDIAGHALVDVLKQHGYDETAPTVIVLEGITHYLPPDVCRRILARFVSPAHANTLIIEYGQPFETLSESVRSKAAVAYGAIEERYHVQGMTKYTPEWVEDALRTLGGKLTHVFHMDEMEKMRSGANHFFEEPNSGWVEVATGLL